MARRFDPVAATGTQQRVGLGGGIVSVSVSSYPSYSFGARCSGSRRRAGTPRHRVRAPTTGAGEAGGGPRPADLRRGCSEPARQGSAAGNSTVGGCLRHRLYALSQPLLVTPQARPRPIRLQPPQYGQRRLTDGPHIGEMLCDLTPRVTPGGREAAEQRAAERVDHHVCRPDAPMDDPVFVEIANRLRDFLDGTAEFLEPLWPPRRQRLPARVAREKAQPALVVGERHETDDPRVVEVGEKRGLGSERFGGSTLLDGNQLLLVQFGPQSHRVKDIKHQEIIGKEVAGQALPDSTGQRVSGNRATGSGCPGCSGCPRLGSDRTVGILRGSRGQGGVGGNRGIRLAVTASSKAAPRRGPGPCVTSRLERAAWNTGSRGGRNAVM